MTSHRWYRLRMDLLSGGIYENAAVVDGNGFVEVND